MEVVKKCKSEQTINENLTYPATVTITVCKDETAMY